MRIHKGERPYQCPCCSKTFTQSGNLKVHMRIHSGEKPFACDLCGRRFTQTSGLKSHLEVHKRQQTSLAATDEANKIKNGWHPRVKTTVNDDLVRSCALSSGNPFVTLYIFFQTVGRPRAMPFLFCPKLWSFRQCHKVVYASRILSHRLLDMDLKSDFLGRTSPLLLTLSNHAAYKQVFGSHEVIVKVVIPKPSSFITTGVLLPF